jgi:hypothetical protein
MAEQTSGKATSYRFCDFAVTIDAIFGKELGLLDVLDYVMRGSVL